MIKCLRKKKDLTEKYWLLTGYTRAYDYKFLTVWRSKEYNQAYNGDGVTVFVMRGSIWVHLQWDLLCWQWFWLQSDFTIEEEQNILIEFERNMPPFEHSLETILSFVVSVWVFNFFCILWQGLSPSLVPLFHLPLLFSFLLYFYWWYLSSTVGIDG